MSRPQAWTSPSTACGATPSSTFRFRAATAPRRMDISARPTSTIRRLLRSRLPSQLTLSRRPHEPATEMRVRTTDPARASGTEGRFRELLRPLQAPDRAPHGRGPPRPLDLLGRGGGNPLLPHLGTGLAPPDELVRV